MELRGHIVPKFAANLFSPSLSHDMWVADYEETWQHAFFHHRNNIL